MIAETIPDATHINISSKLNKLTAFVLFILAIIFSFRQVYSPDIGFHLKAGEWILENLKFPSKDMFTYTASMNDYIDMYWLYQVVVAVINKLAGEFGLVVSKAMLVAASFLLLLIRINRKRSLAATSYWQVLFFLAVWAVAFQFETRPHSFSWIYLNFIFLILEDYYDRGINRLVFLPLVMLLWVNTHTVFILGWIVIGCYVVGFALRERSVKTPLIAFALLSLGVCFINPYFARGVALPFNQFQFLQTHSTFKEVIAEYTTPMSLEGYDIHGRFVLLQPLFPFHIAFALSIIAFLRRFKRIQLHEVLIFGLFLYLVISGVKNIGYFIFAVIPMTIDGFQRSASADQTILEQRTLIGYVRRVIEACHSQKIQTAFSAITICVSILLMMAIVTNTYYFNFRSNDRFGFQYNQYSLPVQTANFLHDRGLDGKILNHFNVGGYLIHTIPQKVFIDGRNEVIGEKLFWEYSMLWHAVDKQPILNKYQPEIIMFPHQDEFLWVHYLKGDSAWRLVDLDEVAAIYVRAGYANNIPAVDSTISSKEYENIADSQIDTILRTNYQSTFPLFSFRKNYFPQREIALSTFCYYNDWFDAAIQIGLNGLARSTVACSEMYYNLGHYFFEKKEYERSAYCYQRFLETNSDQLARARLSLIRSGRIQKGNAEKQ